MAKRPTDPKPSDVVPASPPEAFTYEGKRYGLYPLALLFPRLSRTAFAELVESIRVHGLQQPIVVMGSALDIIVDGVNRFLAALEAGVELRFKELPPGKDPVDYIETANMDRRDLLHLLQCAPRCRASVARAIKRIQRPRGDGGMDDQLRARLLVTSITLIAMLRRLREPPSGTSVPAL